MSAIPEFVYFNSRGLGETTRIIFAAAGIKYKETNVATREDYLAVKEELAFEQLPLLRMDGLSIVQSRAIVRHVARKGNLLGKDPLEDTRITMLYEGTRDFFDPFVYMVFKPEETQKKILKENIFPRYFPAFSKVLKASSDGIHLVGSSLTLADLGLLEVLLAVVDYFGEEQLNDYPEVKKFYESMVAVPNIAQYIREVRKPMNTPAYIEMVKDIFLWKELPTFH